MPSVCGRLVLFDRKCMRLAVTLILIVGMTAACSKQQDPAEQALADARRLADDGRYEEALQKHVWFHENALRIRPSYYGVRLSFALADWVKLGSRYPKALEKLRDIRDEKDAKLRGGLRDSDLFHDVASINQYLGESTRTVSLFKQLHCTNPQFAQDCFDLAVEALVEAGEFGLCKEYLGDPDQRFSEIAASRKRGLGYASRKSGRTAQAATDAFNSIYVNAVCRLLQILAQTGDEAKAIEIQKQALATYPDNRIEEALRKK